MEGGNEEEGRAMCLGEALLGTQIRRMHEGQRRGSACRFTRHGLPPTPERRVNLVGFIIIIKQLRSHQTRHVNLSRRLVYLTR